jgi:hypothetical protein
MNASAENPRSTAAAAFWVDRDSDRSHASDGSSRYGAVARLAAAHGAVHALLSRAGLLRQGTGAAPGECVAAAAVELINRGGGGNRLAPWWRGQR